MKKYILFLSVFSLFITLLGFNADMVSAQTASQVPGCSSTAGYSSTTGVKCDTVFDSSLLPAGCTSTRGYSPTTGVKCDSVVNSSLPPGCFSNQGYSVTTGQRCSDTLSFPPGCSSNSGFSVTTGQSCDSSIPTPVIPVYPPGCTSYSGYSSTTGEACNGTNLSSITVLSPNGGEELVKGNTTNIRWSGGVYPVKVGVVRANYPAENSIVGWIQVRANANGTLGWDTDNIGSLDYLTSGQSWSIDPGQYKIVVLSTDSNYDVSDSTFTISSSTLITPPIPSDDARKSAIYSYYANYLARNPDDAGLLFYLNGGMTLEQIRANILASQEYKNRREAIRQAYLELLKREPEQAGWDYWSNNGATVDTMRQTTINGYEYEVKKQITALYVELLGRQPDDQGLNYYYDRIYTHKWTIEDVRSNIKVSSEYLNHSSASNLGASVISASPSFPLGCSSAQGYSPVTGNSCSGQ